MSNQDTDAKKNYVERLFAVEREFIAAKDERGDFRKELKAEIKSKIESLGFEFNEVDRLVKIKLEEQEAREAADLARKDLEAYEILFGTIEEEDPLAA